MPLDCSRADVELGGDLRIGATVTSEPRDVLLLWSELRSGVVSALPHLLTGRGEFPACAFGDGGLHQAEHLMSGAQVLACIRSTPLTDFEHCSTTGVSAAQRHQHRRPRGRLSRDVRPLACRQRSVPGRQRVVGSRGETSAFEPYGCQAAVAQELPISRWLLSARNGRCAANTSGQSALLATVPDRSVSGGGLGTQAPT